MSGNGSYPTLCTQSSHFLNVPPLAQQQQQNQGQHIGGSTPPDDIQLTIDFESDDNGADDVVGSLLGDSFHEHSHDRSSSPQYYRGGDITLGFSNEMLHTQPAHVSPFQGIVGAQGIVLPDQPVLLTGSGVSSASGSTVSSSSSSVAAGSGGGGDGGMGTIRYKRVLSTSTPTLNFSQLSYSPPLATTTTSTATAAPTGQTFCFQQAQRQQQQLYHQPAQEQQIFTQNSRRAVPMPSTFAVTTATAANGNVSNIRQGTKTTSVPAGYHPCMQFKSSQKIVFSLPTHRKSLVSSQPLPFTELQVHKPYKDSQQQQQQQCLPQYQRYPQMHQQQSQTQPLHHTSSSSHAWKDHQASAASLQKSSHCVGSYYYPSNSQGFAGKYPPPSFSRASAIGTATPIPITVLDPGKSQASPVPLMQQQLDGIGDAFSQKRQQQQQQQQSGFVVSSHIFIPQKLKGSAKTPEALYKELFPEHPIPPSIFLTSE